MKKYVLVLIGIFITSGLFAQLYLETSSIGINTTPGSGITLEVKGGNGRQIRLNNSGQSSTSLEFANNGNLRGLIEIDSVLNQFRIASDYFGQDFTFYTSGTERFRITADGVVSVPGGIKFGGITPSAGTVRWNGNAFEGFDGTTWKPLGVDKDNLARKKTMQYLDNDIY